MKHLIIVEGVTDKGIVQKIAEKLGIHAKILLMRGNRQDKAVRLANSALAGEEYSKIIVLKDQHQHSENKILQTLDKIVGSIEHSKTYPIMVRKAIEAWILAGMGISNAESLDKPDEYLDRILRKRDREYIKSLSTAKKLIENIDLQQACRNSSTLKQFIEILKDP